MLNTTPHSWSSEAQVHSDTKNQSESVSENIPVKSQYGVRCHLLVKLSFKKKSHLIALSVFKCPIPTFFSPKSKGTYITIWKGTYKFKMFKSDVCLVFKINHSISPPPRHNPQTWKWLQIMEF